MTPTLQQKLEDIEDRLRYLKAQFPEWRAWGSGYGPGNEPPTYYVEIKSLEKEREHIVLALSKRQKLAMPVKSTKDVDDVGRKPSDEKLDHGSVEDAVPRRDPGVLTEKPYEHTIASWKQRSQNSLESLGRPGLAIPRSLDAHKYRSELKMDVSDIEFIRNEVWGEFFEAAEIPRVVELRWQSVLSSEKMPSTDVDLALTLALTQVYVKAISRVSGKLADLLVTAAITRINPVEITDYPREAIWRECLDFAAQLSQWDKYGAWVDRAMQFRWQAPLTEDGAVDREQLERAIKNRRDFFKKKIGMYWLEWLSAIDRAIDLRLTASATHPSPSHTARILLHDQWHSLGEEFASLASEERAISHTESKDHSLRAQCNYQEHPEVIERGKPEQGFFCLLHKPEFGLWLLSEGPNENFQARLQALSTRAGVALGSPKGADALDFWLHRLFLDLRENNSDELFAVSDEGGMIVHVCAASATFCYRLEKKALESSQSLPERHGSPSSERQSFVLPILAKKGWSTLDWAIASEVDFHTADNYLKGTSKPYNSTRAKLAKSLGVEVHRLPG
jgi:hypothetical protein